VIAATAHRYTEGTLPTLSALLDRAGAALSKRRQRAPKIPKVERPDAQSAEAPGDAEKAGLLFTGNPHESVPRRLLLDNRLTPLERNAWQVFRLLLNEDGLTSFPTYEQLRPYLASSPFKLASRETVAKALTTLRLTRWISLAGRVRDEITGQMKGNIYLLHDEPVSISEALLLDSSYLELLGNAQTHANKAIRDLAAFTLEEFQRNPHVRDKTVPTRLDILGERVAKQSWTLSPDVQGPSESEPGQKDSELSENHQVRNPAAQSSESEPIRKSGLRDPVRIPNLLRTSTYTDVFKSSVPRARAETGENYPAAFHALPFDQRQKILVAMGLVHPELQDQVLAQWAARCEQNRLHNPVGYLLRMIDKARNGQFNELSSATCRPPVSGAQSPRSSETPPTEPPGSTQFSPRKPPTAEQRDIARKAMEELMRNMRGVVPGAGGPTGRDSRRKNT
jgi:hypothetical protein